MTVVLGGKGKKARPANLHKRISKGRFHPKWHDEIDIK